MSLLRDSPTKGDKNVLGEESGFFPRHSPIQPADLKRKGTVFKLKHRRPMLLILRFILYICITCCTVRNRDCAFIFGKLFMHFLALQETNRDGNIDAERDGGLWDPYKQKVPHKCLTQLCHNLPIYCSMYHPVLHLGSTVRDDK